MIVVGGESLVDLVPARQASKQERRERELLLSPRLGGGPYNTALAAARLGAPTSFLSRMSTDRFGSALRDRLSDSHVDISMIQSGSEPTSLAVVALAEGGSASYTFYTEGTADRLFEDPGSLPDEVRILSLGTLGMVLEPGVSAYEQVLRREAARGVLTVLDPNIRIDLINDPDAYRTRFRSWLKDVRLLKLSDDDARWLTGAETADLDSAARSWLEQGVQAVVLTRGSAGLAVITDTDTISVAAPATEVADTIGAGDTVQGALLAWLHQREITDIRSLDKEKWREALRYAAAAAAITVSRVGAEPPTSAELDKK